MSCESFDCFADGEPNDPEELSEDTGDALRLSS